MLLRRIYFSYLAPHISAQLHLRAARAWRVLRKPAEITRYLPAGVRAWFNNKAEQAKTRYFLWRIKPRPTRMLGPLWPRKGNIAEIDITYSCNLKCFNCNRSCEQDPSNDRMTVEQVGRFLEESREKNLKWRHIRLLGGEPTTHPDFFGIVDLVRRYRDDFSPLTRIVVVTNGHGERVNKVLSRVPNDVDIENTAKSTKVQTEFHTFNVAPRDTEGYNGADYSNACSVVTVCGVGVTPYGYYPCAVAGAIDRTFGLNIGRKKLPSPDDPMTNELRKCCALCGLFKPHLSKELDGPMMSATWEEAYARAQKTRPELSRLPESQNLVQLEIPNA